MVHKKWSCRNKLVWCLGIYCVYLTAHFFSMESFEQLRKKEYYMQMYLTEPIKRPVLKNTSHHTTEPSLVSESNQLNFCNCSLQPTFPSPKRGTKPRPQFQIGEIELNADIIVGITTVKRNGADYLLDTLTSLISSREDDGTTVKFLIFIGETNLTYVRAQSQKISSAFPNELRSGVLQVISPPKSYYPRWNVTLRKNFNDSFERVKWRSKQNLDQIFLMLHVYYLSPTYYLMMEDDVIASKGYVKKIMSTATEKRNDDWFYLSFCSLGAIGKLFRTSSLLSYSKFLQIFWNIKPLDWIQNDYLVSSYCSYDESEEQCKARCRNKTPNIKPALFQHKGKISSLKGKIQNLVDKSFNEIPPPKG